MSERQRVAKERKENRGAKRDPSGGAGDCRKKGEGLSARARE
jgi:hypothetical protein